MSASPCGFSAGAAAFVTLSSLADNRLNVYDVASGAQLAQLVPEGHLSKLNACTALALGAPLKRKKKAAAAGAVNGGSKGGSELGLAAVGTERGTVLVWNLQVPWRCSHFAVSCRARPSAGPLGAVYPVI
jgi:hypothetical protein